MPPCNVVQTVETAGWGQRRSRKRSHFGVSCPTEKKIYVFVKIYMTGIYFIV